jgi:hypothetical protein
VLHKPNRKRMTRYPISDSYPGQPVYKVLNMCMKSTNNWVTTTALCRSAIQEEKRSQDVYLNLASCMRREREARTACVSCGRVAILGDPRNGRPFGGRSGVREILEMESPLDVHSTVGRRSGVLEAILFKF